MRLTRRFVAVAVALTLLGAFSGPRPARATDGDAAAGRVAPAGPVQAGGSAARAPQNPPSPAEVLGNEELDGFRVDVEFVETGVRDVLRFFAETVGLNIVIDPEVDGVVNVSMNDAPWDVALVAILGSHGLDFAVRGNIVRFTTVAKLIDEATARARLGDEQRRASPLRTVTLKLSYAQAADLVPIVERQLSERGTVIADVRANALIITDTEATIRAIRRLIDGGVAPEAQRR